MTTVLLLDDELVFKAVEGTCLRREPCRLVKADWAGVPEAARTSRPDLILAADRDAGSRAAIARLLADTAVREVPVIVLQDRRGERPGPAGGLPPDRPGALEFVPVRSDGLGNPDFEDLDPRLDAVVRKRLEIAGRRQDRVVVSLPVRCDGGGLHLTLRTKNISPSGLFLKTDLSIPPGERLDVCFSLKAPGIDPVAVSGVAEVVRQVRSPGSGAETGGDLIPGVGVRFLDLAEGSARALRRFVQVASRGALRPSPPPRTIANH